MSRCRRNSLCRAALPAALLVLFGLSGCVAYPAPGYPGGYAYAPAPVYVAPAPVVVGGCWGCGFRGHGWR